MGDGVFCSGGSDGDDQLDGGPDCDRVNGLGGNDLVKGGPASAMAHLACSSLA